MKKLTVIDHSTPFVVPITRVYQCDLCNDTGRYELMDADGFPSGYYKPCPHTL